MRRIITNDILKNMICDYRKGINLDELSSKYGFQTQSIQRKFKASGITITKGKSVRFAEEELENIIYDYKNGMRPFELENKYNRDSGTIIGKLKTLGLYENNNYRFSHKDIEFLKEYYPLGDWRIINDRFPNVSKCSIHTKMSSLNISMNNYFWSSEDENILKDNYSNMYGRIDDLVKLFNNKYSYVAITAKARRLSLKTRDFWNDNEIQLLIEKYPKFLLDDLMVLFPNRSRSSIISKAMSLKLVNKIIIETRFDKDDRNYVFENYNKLTDKELGKIIGKSDKSICDFRFRNGLIKTHEESSYNDLSEYVRGNNLEWKKKSILNCNYKCIVTGERFDDIHHIHGLNLILSETLEEANINIKSSMNDYSEEELRLILDCFREKQNQYPLGVCLTKNIHMKFHEIYGYGNNTALQWNEFLECYKSGKYKNVA